MKAIRNYYDWEDYNEYKPGDKVIHVFDDPNISNEEILQWISDNEIELFDVFNTSVTLDEEEDLILICTDSFESYLEIIEI